MRNIWIAIPAYTGQVHIATMRSLMTDFLSLAKRGDKVTIYDESASAIIADARATIVAKFLNSDADTLLFIDNDVAWEAGAATRLIDHPVDIVGGVYPMRKDKPEYRIMWDMSKDELWEDENGLLEVEAIPAGFLKITREALEIMVHAYKNLEYFSESSPDQKAFALFDPFWEYNVKYGEDFSFCKRWRKLGGSIYVDPNINMAHVGLKTFTGSLAGWLKDRL